MNIYIHKSNRGNRFFCEIPSLTPEQTNSLLKAMGIGEALLKDKNNPDVALVVRCLEMGLVPVKPDNIPLTELKGWFETLQDICTAPEQKAVIRLLPRYRKIREGFNNKLESILGSDGKEKFTLKTLRSVSSAFNKPVKPVGPEDRQAPAEELGIGSGKKEPPVRLSIAAMAYRNPSNPKKAEAVLCIVLPLSPDERVKLCDVFQSCYGNNDPRERKELPLIFRGLMANYVPLDPYCFRSSEDEQEKEMYLALSEDNYRLFSTALHFNAMYLMREDLWRLIEQEMRESDPKTQDSFLLISMATKPTKLLPMKEPHLIRKERAEAEAEAAKKKALMQGSVPIRVVRWGVEQFCFLDSTLLGDEFQMTPELFKTIYEGYVEHIGYYMNEPLLCGVVLDMLNRGYLFLVSFRGHDPRSYFGSWVHEQYKAWLMPELLPYLDMIYEAQKELKSAVDGVPGTQFEIISTQPYLNKGRELKIVPAGAAPAAEAGYVPPEKPKVDTGTVNNSKLQAVHMEDGKVAVFIEARPNNNEPLVIYGCVLNDRPRSFEVKNLAYQMYKKSMETPYMLIDILKDDGSYQNEFYDGLYNELMAAYEKNKVLSADDKTAIKQAHLSMRSIFDPTAETKSENDGSGEQACEKPVRAEQDVPATLTGEVNGYKLEAFPVEGGRLAIFLNTNDGDSLDTPSAAMVYNEVLYHRFPAAFELAISKLDKDMILVDLPVDDSGFRGGVSTELMSGYRHHWVVKDKIMDALSFANRSLRSIFSPVTYKETEPKSDLDISVGTKVRVNLNKLRSVEPGSIIEWFLDNGDHDEVFTVTKYLPKAFPCAPFMLNGVLCETSFSFEELLIVTEETK